MRSAYLFIILLSFAFGISCQSENKSDQIKIGFVEAFEDETIKAPPADTQKDEREELVEAQKEIQEEEKEQPIEFEDDDVSQNVSENEPGELPLFKDQPEQQLIQTAGSFFTQLGNVLSDAKATENLIQSLTKKDETTGQTYLQIPVENEGVVKNVFSVLAGLFKGMSGQN